MNEECSWPRVGDVLFTGEGDSWHNACVGWSPEQWIGYAEGYKRAADLLVQQVIDTGREQDFLVYPIVFLYRQALEVAIKHVLVKGYQLLDQDERLPLRPEHRLVPLWRDCREILEQVWPKGPKEDLDAVGEVMRQFQEKDPASTSFRYPTDLAGAPTLQNGHINLKNLGEVANRVYSFLDAVVTGITEYLQTKWEMERYAM
jgi:hypothetical protein